MTLLQIASFPQGSIALPTSPVRCSSEPAPVSFFIHPVRSLMAFINLLSNASSCDACFSVCLVPWGLELWSLCMHVRFSLLNTFKTFFICASYRQNSLLGCPLCGNFPLLCDGWALVGAGHAAITQPLSKTVLFSSFFSDYKRFPHSGCYTKLSTPILCYSCCQLSEEINSLVVQCLPSSCTWLFLFCWVVNTEEEEKEPHGFGCSLYSSPSCEVCSILPLSSLPLFAQQSLGEGSSRDLLFKVLI